MKELGADEGGNSPPMNDEDLMIRPSGDDGDNEDADLSLVCSRNVSVEIYMPPFFHSVKLREPTRQHSI